MTSWSKKKFDRIHQPNPYAKALRSSHLRQRLLSTEEEKIDKKTILEELNEED